MISGFNCGDVLRNVTIEHRQIKYNRDIEITTESCCILYLISGRCCIPKSDITLTSASPTILDAGRHTVQCRLGGDTIVEIVVVHINRERLFHTAPQCREQQRFEAAVLRAIATSVSVDDLASVCCLSVSTFKRRFFDYYGTPPHRWLLWRRLEIAEAMLRHTTIPTFVVAHLCGFINVSHFIATFKRRYNVTPSRISPQ